MKTAVVMLCVWSAIVVAVLTGWIMNIVSLLTMDVSTLGVEAVLRIIGIVVVPLGAVMGIFV